MYSTMAGALLQSCCFSNPWLQASTAQVCAVGLSSNTVREQVKDEELPDAGEDVAEDEAAAEAAEEEVGEGEVEEAAAEAEDEPEDGADAADE